MTPSSSEARFRNELPGALRLLRKARGFTQEELAGRAGIQQAVLCRYETGASTPTAARLAVVLHALVASWTELDLALAEVQRAADQGDEPSQKAVLERPESTQDDLMIAFMNASQEGRGPQFVHDLLEQVRYLARLQSRMSLQKVFEEESEDEPKGDGDDRAADGDGGTR